MIWGLCNGSKYKNVFQLNSSNERNFQKIE